MALSGRLPKRYSHYANGTASRPQGSPFRATGAFSRGKGEAASGGAGRAGAVSARALGKGRIDRGPLTITDLTSAGPHDGAPSAPEPPS